MDNRNAVEPVTLWGPTSSLYSGKTRAYLIKKGIPFRALNPSHPRYMSEIVPRIGECVAAHLDELRRAALP